MTPHEASALPRGAEAFQGQPAGIISRSVAAVIDGVVVATVMAAGYLAFSGVLFAWNPRTFGFPAPSGWFTVAAAGIVATVYLTVGWWIAGRTYGAALMGLRVVSRDDRDLPLGLSLVRAVTCVVFPLGLIWCALDHRARALQDLLVRSRVIYDWRHHEH
jgi:uncharacterized RDD family membrane protein YckC